MRAEKRSFKILQVNNVYRIGSTGKITYDIHSSLKKRGYSSIVCYGRGSKTNDDSDVYKISGEFYAKANNFLSRITGLMYGGCKISTKKLISIIKREKPDIVHLQCLNGYFVNIYRLIEWLKTNDVKTVLTLHAEFMHTANCGYALECDKWKNGCGNCPRVGKETKSYFFDRTHTSWVKMKKAFDAFDRNLIVASVSPWLMDRAMSSPILAEKNHIVVMNGLDTEVFHIYSSNRIFEKHNIVNKKIIFHATPSFDLNPNNIKGGYYINEIAKRLLDEDVVFIIAGRYDKHVTYSKNIIFLGRIDDQNELAEYYSAATLTLLTSKKETFSMVTAESLCCGTPVVGFKAGAPEQIAIPDYSAFSLWGDIDQLENNVRIFLNNQMDNNIIEKQAHNLYSTSKMVNDYIDAYERLQDGE